jgi:hypothetical protein
MQWFFAVALVFPLGTQGHLADHEADFALGVVDADRNLILADAEVDSFGQGKDIPGRPADHDIHNLIRQKCVFRAQSLRLRSAITGESGDDAMVGQALCHAHPDDGAVLIDSYALAGRRRKQATH